jgi:TolB-like protein
MKKNLICLLSVMLLVVGCASIDPKMGTEKLEQRSSFKSLDGYIDTLADQITQSLSEQQLSKIAVVEFPDIEGKPSALGKYLSEELTTRLFKTGRFQLIERQLINKIMEEQKLSAMGLVDEKTARQIGSILGVDAITTGTITDLNTSVKINARLIASGTGSIFSVASIQVPMSREVEILLGKRHSAQSSKFDGTWDVSIVCPPHKATVHEYHLMFLATVKDGVLHGQYRNEGSPGSLMITGRIQADGNSLIEAQGFTGDPKYAVAHVSRGTPVYYHVKTHFEGTKGLGSRVEHRVCNYSFTKRQ